MHSLLAVVFETEVKVNGSKEALLQLEAEGKTVIHGYAVVAKHPDGNITVTYEDAQRPFFTFAEPVGSESGYMGVAASKSVPVSDRWDNSRLSTGFIDDVKKVMLPNRVALVADIEEELLITVDARMEQMGGTVFRWPVTDRV